VTDALDALSCDPAVMDAQLAERPARRTNPYGIGAGEVAKAMLCLGLRDMESAPDWLRKECAPMKRHGNVPRFILVKAGRVAKRKMGDAQHIGVRREEELFERWLREVRAGYPMPLDIDPDTAVWAGWLPDEFPPWLDNMQRALTVRTDGWARTWDGRLVTLSIKCARYGYSKPAWWNGIDRLPWYYQTQCQAEMAALRGKHALAIIGCGWNRDADDPRSDGPVRVLREDRDECAIEEVRGAAGAAWAAIQKLRAA
jgi:hypothetical protein